MGTRVLSWERRGSGVKLTTTSTQGVDKENYLLPFTASITA